MNPLDRFVPSPRLREINDVDLAIPAERAWEIVRHLDLGRYPIARALFALRTSSGAPDLRIDDLISSAEHPGFQALAEEPGRAIVFGAIGRVWKRDIPFVHVAPGAFAAYAEPGYVKVAWSIAVEPLGAFASRVVIELRVDATDARAWKMFRRYFRVIGPGSRVVRRTILAALAHEHGGRRPTLRDVVQGAAGAGVAAAALFTPFLRRARSHWGLRDDVVDRAYPGDEIVPAPRWSYTHGLEIEAPAERVWPWVAQIGRDRGGFYSYEWLENLVGCALHNASEIHPEWAHRTGDELSLHPNGPALSVRVASGRWLLATARPKPHDRAWIAASWLLFVEPLGLWRSRLVSRYRVATSSDLATRALMGPIVMEPIAFAMDRKMLLGIKELAEQHARSASPTRDRRGLPRGARV